MKKKIKKSYTDEINDFFLDLKKKERSFFMSRILGDKIYCICQSCLNKYLQSGDFKFQQTNSNILGIIFMTTLILFFFFPINIINKF